jgi:hyperosmotically inducible protein
MTKVLALSLLFAAIVVLPGCGASSGGGGMQPAGATIGAMDDPTITARVKTVLLNDTQVSATKIDVTTTGGIVTISGTVRSAAEEARAIELARGVTGVREVKSALQIAPEA